MSTTNKPSVEDILKKVWGNRTDMVNYCLKSSFVDMGEYYLDFGDKPVISNKIYYSDQKPGSYEMADDPGTSWEVFKKYNLDLNLNSIDYSRGKNLCITTADNKTDGLVKYWSQKYTAEMRNGDRLATEEEKKIIEKYAEEKKEEYILRLERYYKRYQNKITTVSYWADR